MVDGAFVLWDEAHQTLFAARDRFGIKPLYYGRHKDTLYLASEVKALFAAGVPARWDHESVFQFGNFLSFQQDRTVFDGDLDRVVIDVEQQVRLDVLLPLVVFPGVQ